MKSLVAFVLIVALAFGGTLYYNFQQSSHQAEWSVAMHSYMQQLAEYQSTSQNEMRSEAAANLNRTSREIGELRAAIEGLTFSISKPEELEKLKEIAEDELAKAVENTKNLDTSELPPEIKEHYEAIKDLKPEDILRDPEAARRRAQELRDHYDKIVIDLSDRTQRRSALREKLDQLQKIEPRTNDIAKQIEETKDEITKIDKEIERLKKERDQTKRVLDLFKAILRLAAIFSFASGNPALGRVLLLAAGMLEGVSENDGETGGTGGGFPPLPPPPPYNGGRGNGDIILEPDRQNPPPLDFDTLPGPVSNGIQLLFQADGVYTRSGSGDPKLLFKADEDTIDLIRSANEMTMRVNISEKSILLEKDGVGFRIVADPSGRATTRLGGFIIDHNRE